MSKKTNFFALNLVLIYFKYIINTERSSVTPIFKNNNILIIKVYLTKIIIFLNYTFVAVFIRNRSDLNVLKEIIYFCGIIVIIIFY